MKSPILPVTLLMVLLSFLCYFSSNIYAHQQTSNSPSPPIIIAICNSRLRRCIPDKLSGNIADEISKSSKLYLVFSDVRSSEAARSTLTKYPKASIIPCDITDFGSSSILSCIAGAVASSLLSGSGSSTGTSSGGNSNTEESDQLIYFISGAASSVPPNTFSTLRDSLVNNGLSATTGVSIIYDPNSKENIVYSSGFSRAPRYRSSLGGINTLVTVLPNQVGLSANDARARNVQQVDSIDFTASVVTAQTFLQSSVHSPMPYERAVEWCPSAVDELQWLVYKISQVEDASRMKRRFDSSSSSTQKSSNNNNTAATTTTTTPTNRAHNHHHNKKKKNNKNKDKDKKKKNRYFLTKEQRQELRKQRQQDKHRQQQLVRALKWLESIDSDICNVRTRYGLRFDEMFVYPASPVLLGGELGVVQPNENSDQAIDSLLFRLSSIVNDLTVSSQIIKAMESIAQFGNSLAVLPSVQVQVESTASLTTIGVPSVTVSSSSSVRASSSTSGGGGGGGNTNANTKERKFPLVVIWDQYCCHCCGFSSEIERFVLPLTCTVYLTSHLSCFCTGQREYERLKLEGMYVTPERLAAHPATDVVIWISHAQPYLFAHPLQEVHPIDYHIARMMFEWSRIHPAWVNEIKSGVNEVWVPGSWVQQVFVQSGVPVSKIFVIPEAVDTHRFNPDVVEKYNDIDVAAKENGWNLKCSKDFPSGVHDKASKHFTFFSNFKWEDRKGWTTLLAAYEQFGREHPNLAETTSLYILTFSFENKDNPRDHTIIKKHIDEWYAGYRRSRKQGSEGEVEEDWRLVLPRLCLIVDIIPDDQMDRLYASADAFVLPTRGEGWGLPLCQAMSMGKPVIATRWSGQTEFMTDEVSFYIELEGLEEPESRGGDQAPGSKWAIPSASHLKEIMAYVVSHPEVAKEMGRKARQHIVAHFSDEAVRAIIEKRLRVIHDFVASLYR